MADAPRTLEYSWLTDDRVTGSQTVSYAADGTITILFEYADRGRGPKITSTLETNANGVPSRFTATGFNNTRAIIAERFVVTDSVADWNSSLERGQQRFEGNEFFLPFNASPEVRAVLARALLRDPDRTIALLPGGRASLDELASTELTRQGESKRITLYRINGIDLGPSYVWLDDHNDLFGYKEKRSFGIVLKGWESSLPELKAAEKEATDQYYAALSLASASELSGLAVVKGARIFDSVAGRMTAPATVFIWQGSISAVYFGETDIPDDAIVIDASGKTLMPGLWDMHNHMVTEYLPEYLAFGVTNVRDLGNNHDDLQHLVREVRDGRLAGPDIHPLGFIDGRGDFAAPVGKLAGSLDEALSFVDFYARHGYRGIKLYSSIRPDWVSPLARAADARGMRVSGHIPAFMSVEQAVLAGYSEVTHVNQLLMAFLEGERVDTRGPARFLVPGERTGDLDVESADVQRFISLMLERHVALDTTLAPIMEMFRNRPGEMSPIFSEVADGLPEAVRRKLVMTEGYNQGREEAFARSSDTVLRFIATLHRAGVPLLPGTDNLLPGFTLIRELIYYTEAGIPTNEVLQLGTIVPARHMGLDHRLGSISVGKDAHMYVVDGNPIDDINALYRVEHVFKGRRLYYAPDLLRAQGFVPLRRDSGVVLP